MWMILFGTTLFLPFEGKVGKGGDAQVLLNVEYIQIRGKVLIQSSIKKR